jgi:hypothetical protein
MNVQTIGATRRPKLSLPFGQSQGNSRTATPERTPSLPAHELRRIVAAMIG